MLDNVFYIISAVVEGALTVVLILFLVRAVMNLLVGPGENVILEYAVMVTEIFICPVRAVFDHFGWGQDSPIDLPALAAMFIVTLITSLL